MPTYTVPKVTFRDIAWNVAGKTWYYMWNNLCSIRFSSTFHVIYLDCFSNSVPLHGQRHFVSYTVYALSGCWSTCNFLDLVCVIVIIVVPPVLSKIIHLCTCCSASSHFSKSCPPYIVHCQIFFQNLYQLHFLCLLFKMQ